MGCQNLVCGELEALRVKNRELKILFAAGTVERIILIRMDQLVRRDRTAAANHFVLDALPHALDQELVTAANNAALCKGDQRFWNRASEAAAFVNDRHPQIFVISRADRSPDPGRTATNDQNVYG